MQANSCTVPTFIALTGHFVVFAFCDVMQRWLVVNYKCFGEAQFKGQAALSTGFTEPLYCIDKYNVNWRFIFAKRLLCTFLSF